MVNLGFGREYISIRNANPQGEVSYRCTRLDKSEDKSADRSDIVTRADKSGMVSRFWHRSKTLGF